jgi:hypothetical protein
MNQVSNSRTWCTAPACGKPADCAGIIIKMNALVALVMVFGHCFPTVGPSSQVKLMHTVEQLAQFWPVAFHAHSGPQASK